jgi:hypothetical protein
VAVNTEEGSSDIYIVDLNSNTSRRLTFENENSTDPLWTPDGQRVVFLAGEGDEMGIYWKAADGRGTEELLALVSDGGGPPWSWADDGKTLVTTKRPLSSGGARAMPSPAMLGRMMRGGGMRGRGSGPTLSRSGLGRSPGSEGSSTSEETSLSTDIGTLSMEGDHEWQSLLNLKERVIALQISPDGRWMAYSTWELGGSGVIVRPFPDVEGGRWQVPGQALRCLWSPSGQELFYTNTEDDSLMAIEVGTEPTFEFGKPEVLFNPVDIGLDYATTFFDISRPDGKRFLMMKEAATTDNESQAKEAPAERPRKIIVVTNWFEELKERVPAD